MIITEAELRDQLRRPTSGAQVTIPAGARLSPSATDFVNQWSLVVVEGGAVPTPAPTAAQPAASDGGVTTTSPSARPFSSARLFAHGSPWSSAAPGWTGTTS